MLQVTLAVTIFGEQNSKIAKGQMCKKSCRWHCQTGAKERGKILQEIGQSLELRDVCQTCQGCAEMHTDAHMPIETDTERCLSRLCRDAHISVLPIETDTERMGFPNLPRFCRYAAHSVQCTLPIETDTAAHSSVLPKLKCIGRSKEDMFRNEISNLEKFQISGKKRCTSSWGLSPIINASTDSSSNLLQHPVELHQQYIANIPLRPASTG